jgi:Flp pilus assembly protein TadG
MSCAGESIKTVASRWWRREDGLAAMEFALVFPVLMTLLMGVYDFGNAFLVNQKVITASQMMADLVSRSVAITQEQLNDVAAAGRMAMEPYANGSFAYDIVSVRYDDDSVPEICWNHNSLMNESADLAESTESLAEPGEGAVVVAVRYTYEPLFAGRIIGDLDMEEVAYARGRRVPVVSIEIDDDIGCEDDF